MVEENVAKLMENPNLAAALELLKEMDSVSQINSV